MGPKTRHRGSGALGAIVVLAILIAPVALLVHGSAPKPATAGGQAATADAGGVRLSRTCARTANDGPSLAQQYAALKPGQTVCLLSGDYGKFIAGRRPGVVGVRAKEGERATMSIEFDSVENLRIDDVTITAATLKGRTRNVTIANSRFTGLAVVLTDDMQNANIHFDHNVHANVDTCATCYAGRLHIEGHGPGPTGIVVSNSVFSGGNSDGIRADADGIQIIDNEFYGFRDQEPFHTDPIQIYGGNRILIRGNYFHDNAVSAQIMMADGGSKNVVEDNVISPGGYTWAITWFSDDSSIIRHNTFANGECNSGIRCGMVNLGAKSNDPAGHGTVIRDNVMTGISNHGGAKLSAFVADHNLTATPLRGAKNLVGTAKFQGPLHNFRDFKLAPGSPGTRDASDGSDTGIR